MIISYRVILQNLFNLGSILDLEDYFSKDTAISKIETEFQIS